MTTLYRAYDADDRLLYIGITDDVYRRLDKHAVHSPWAVHATKITLERHPDRETATAAERSAIDNEDLVFNRDRRSNGRGPRNSDRFTRWMIAYPTGRHADDISDEELADTTERNLAWLDAKYEATVSAFMQRQTASLQRLMANGNGGGDHAAHNFGPQDTTPGDTDTNTSDHHKAGSPKSSGGPGGNGAPGGG